jgi:hypothetical protein
VDAPLGVMKNAAVEASSEGTRPPRGPFEDEAYVPREPGPEVERYWLPSTRAFAIEWAPQARLAHDSGLAVDDATLERVADAQLADARRRGGLAA